MATTTILTQILDKTEDFKNCTGMHLYSFLIFCWCKNQVLHYTYQLIFSSFGDKQQGGVPSAEDSLAQAQEL